MLPGGYASQECEVLGLILASKTKTNDKTALQFLKVSLNT